ncbi:MAG: hypothetical protein D6751_04120 [Deltaproteobacteria bacterium]|nr:MAG: hypothetical protein D6751_04120 [Deltaproteobacteria bacterium]
MPQAKGANAQILIQEETTFATDPATPDARKVYISGCSLKLNRALESSDILRGNRNPTRPARGNDDVSGGLSTELQAYIGLLLKATLGSVTTTGTGPYTHTFKVGSSLPSLLIEKGFPDIGQYFKYNGCKVSRLSLSITPSGFQKVDFEFLGAKETTGSTSFDTTPLDLGKVSFDGFAVGAIEEGGVAIGDVVGIDGLTFENDLDGEQYLLGGSGTRVDIPEGTVKVSGTLKARFKDLALYTKAIAGTESSLRVLFQLGTGDGSSGNESLEIKLPELIYAPNAPVIDGPKGIIVELPFEAYYEDSTEASAMQIILKNTQATV